MINERAPRDTGQVVSGGTSAESATQSCRRLTGGQKFAVGAGGLAALILVIALVARGGAPSKILGGVVSIAAAALGHRLATTRFPSWSEMRRNCVRNWWLNLPLLAMVIVVSDGAMRPAAIVAGVLVLAATAAAWPKR